jgi:hypothetical protein
VDWFGSLLQLALADASAAIRRHDLYLHAAVMIGFIGFCFFLLSRQQVDPNSLLPSQNIEGIFFVMLTVSSLSCTSDATRLFHDVVRFDALRASGVTGAVRYWLTTSFHLLLLRTLFYFIIVALSAVLFSYQATTSAGVVFKLGEVIGTTAAASSAIAFAAASMAPTAGTAMVAAAAYNAYASLFCGLMLNANHEPITLLTRGSYLHYAFSGLLRAYIESMASGGSQESVTAALASQGLTPAGVAEEFVIPISVAVGACLLSLLALVLRSQVGKM